MKVMIEKLEQYGADIEGAKGRFLNDEELYKSCFDIFIKDESFSKLDAALLAGDYETAFTQAHTLKGVTGNMGLTPLYQIVCELVSALRKQDYKGMEEYRVDIGKQLDLLKAIQE